MAKSIDLATDASRRAALLLSYIQAVCGFVAPCPPGASTAIFDRLSHSRALTLNCQRATKPATVGRNYRPMFPVRWIRSMLWAASLLALPAFAHAEDSPYSSS